MFQQRNKLFKSFWRVPSMNTGNTQAHIAASAATQLGALIEPDQYVEYLEQSSQVSRLDLGSSLISKMIHPALGAILLISTDSGATALIPLM
jgi:hypothetical protein